MLTLLTNEIIITAPLPQQCLPSACEGLDGLIQVHLFIISVCREIIDNIMHTF